MQHNNHAKLHRGAAQKKTDNCVPAWFAQFTNQLSQQLHIKSLYKHKPSHSPSHQRSDGVLFLAGAAAGEHHHHQLTKSIET
jgi:hypothetical protein